MTDEIKDLGDIIEENLNAVMRMSPEEHKAFAKAEIDVMLNNFMAMPTHAERVDAFYELMTDRFNRVFMFGYDIGYKDGYRDAHAPLN